MTKVDGRNRMTKVDGRISIGAPLESPPWDVTSLPGCLNISSDMETAYLIV